MSSTTVIEKKGQVANRRERAAVASNLYRGLDEPSAAAEELRHKSAEFPASLLPFHRVDQHLFY